MYVCSVCDSNLIENEGLVKCENTICNYSKWTCPCRLSGKLVHDKCQKIETDPDFY
jgi:hypothetical protein